MAVAVEVASRRKLWERRQSLPRPADSSSARDKIYYY